MPEHNGQFAPWIVLLLNNIKSTVIVDVYCYTFQIYLD